MKGTVILSSRAKLMSITLNEGKVAHDKRTTSREQSYKSDHTISHLRMTSVNPELMTA